MMNASLYKKLPINKVECTACSWYCKIAEGKSGICGVRKNIKGDLYLLVYGKPVAVNIDPIEKKPLFHFLPGTEIFSVGTVGCNFACDFCQNWDISQIDKCRDAKYCVSTDSDLSPQDIINYCLKNNIPSIAFTYNEPAIFFEYAYDTIKFAKKHGIKTVYVSNGFESKEQIEMLKDNLDAINIDLKAFTEEFYQKVCHAKLAPVLENIKRFYEAGIWTEITTLLIPGENDSEKEITQIAKFLKNISPDLPWHLSAFHPDYKMLNKNTTPLSSLQKAYEIGKKIGLNYIYLGNVPASTLESTYCPNCQSLLIERIGYNIKVDNLKNGQCKKCQFKIPGVWK